MPAATLQDALGNLALEMWVDNVVGDMLLEENPLMGIIDKSWDEAGDPLVMGTTFGSDGGHSSTFANAQANFNSSGEVKWIMALVDEHSIFQITNKTMLSMKRKGRAAMVDGLEHITQKAFKRFKRNMQLSLFRESHGARGQIASGSGTPTITLVDPAEAVHFSIGDYITSSDNLTGTADDGEAIRVAGVDPIGGTLTRTGGNWNDGGNFAANDYLFFDGTKGLKLNGLPDWVPPTDPTATPFNGVDRTQDLVRLGGLRVVADAALDGTHEAAIQRAVALSRRFGSKITDIFLENLDWQQVARELGNPRVELINPRRANGSVVGHISYSSIVLMTPAGPVNLLNATDQRSAVCHGIQRDTWKMFGNREPGLDKHDGNSVLRLNAQAALEGRFEAYLQLGCREPGHNLTLDLTATQQTTP